MFIVAGNIQAVVNIIGNNSGNGIEITNGSTGNLIQSNAIGTDISGTDDFGNGGYGILVAGASSHNLIGGTGLAQGNLIANNLKGVVIGTGVTDISVENAILNNSIYNNTLMGIDLANDGPTSNHSVNPYTGPNDFQNYPVLGTPVITTTGLNVPWIFNSRPSSAFIVQFFKNTPNDAEGRLLLSSMTVVTNASGAASGTLTIPGGVPLNSAITATATYLIGGTTGTAGDTSEFGGTLYNVSTICLTSPCNN